MALEYLALIPAYEPDSKMLEVSRDLRQSGFDVVIVDDGSGKDFEDLFLQASEEATVLTHSINRGKGAALKTGLAYINKYRISGGARASDVVIVTVDADGQHLAKDAFRIAAHAASKPGTLVLGSRALEEDVPLRSKLGNTITRYVYQLSTGLAVHDTQTGLRAFTADMIPRLLEIRGDRYEYEINMLMEFAREGVPIIEEEIETVYLDGNSASHFSTVKDSFRIYKEIIKFSASSFIGFLVDYGMYALLLALTARYALAGSLIIANVGARIVSSVTNYTINRKLVFKSKAGVAKSALQYFALAALILAANTAILSVLTGYFGINQMVAKVITEVLLFSLSWLVQRYVIFYKEQETGRETDAKSGQRWLLAGEISQPAKLRDRQPALRAVYLKGSKRGR
ncbi:MAG: bifunctional glycosyltransferase family 2/GtrA family protein [Mogibacterium sp.]|nr:bifunctional glycosyltransferase family 2/GtrA family protein [Mogibacterium sp.]